LAKDRTPTATSGKPAGTPGRPAGRTRPVTQVVAPSRPWGLIAAAVVVVVFAAAVIGYAVSQVNKANADKITSPGQIAGLETFKYPSGAKHLTTPVTYKESPPVGGDHDPVWADCTGTVYSVDIRHENAVHSLEHGAVWITYNPDQVSPADVATLAAMVKGVTHRLMSPYKGLDSPISIQSWDHQLKVSSVKDKRIKQFADFFTQNDKYYPEIGASCVNADFVTHPLVVGQASSQASGAAPTMSSKAGSSAATSSAAG